MKRSMNISSFIKRKRGIVSTTLLLLLGAFAMESVVFLYTYISYRSALISKTKAAEEFPSTGMSCSGGYPHGYCSPFNNKEYICNNGRWDWREGDPNEGKGRCPSGAIVCIGRGARKSEKYNCCAGLSENNEGICVSKQSSSPTNTPTLTSTPTSIPTATLTPTPTPTPTIYLPIFINNGNSPTPTPLPTSTPIILHLPTASPSVNPSPTGSVSGGTIIIAPTSLPTNTPTPTLFPTSTPMPTFTPTPTLSGDVSFQKQTQGNPQRSGEDKVVSDNLVAMNRYLLSHTDALAHPVNVVYITFSPEYSTLRDYTNLVINQEGLSKLRVFDQPLFFSFLKSHRFWAMTYEDLPAASGIDRPNGQFWRGDIFSLSYLSNYLPQVIIHESVHNLQSTRDSDLAYHVHAGRDDGGEPTTIMGKVYQSLIEGRAESVAMDKTGHYACGQSYAKYRDFFADVENCAEEKKQESLFFAVTEGDYGSLQRLVKLCGGKNVIVEKLRKNGWQF